MKRCPQCEFIYEDDQSLCDMDGVLLVFDSRTLPNLHALATVSGPLPGKAQRRSRMVPAFATLMLTLAIASVYYVSTMRNAAENGFSPAGITAPAAEAPAQEASAPVPPAENPNQAHAPVSEPTPDTTEAEPAKTTPAQPRQTSPSPAASKPAAPTHKGTTTTKPVTVRPEPKKEESKVGSILKKTGKLLKKPFKL